MKIIKRDGTKTLFDGGKIEIAIIKAMRNGSGRIDEELALHISKSIEEFISERYSNDATVSNIEDMVFDKLCENNHQDTAKAYEGYRSIREHQRRINTSDEDIISLISGDNKESLQSNSNKQAALISTQRDLISEEVSKDICMRNYLPPHIVQAHKDGKIYIHDLGHFITKSHNCFSGDTRLITHKGTVAFSDLSVGESIYVPTHTGEWKKAIVKKYGVSLLNEITLMRNGKQTKVIKATKDHRWMLKDESITTNLKVGDRLYQTPIIESYNFDNATKREKLMWCLGFALGDGCDREKNKNISSSHILLRLCGKKNGYANRFETVGFNVTYPKHLNGDGSVYMGGFLKSKILDEYSTYSSKEKVSLFNGLISADGTFRGNNEYSTGIFVANNEIKRLVYNLAELSGYYIGKEEDKTGQVTNYAIKGRKESCFINYNRRQYQAHWRVVSIEETHKEETWCLEVEDNHTFILSGGIVTGNCMLVNLRDMLENGTIINGKMIEKPKSFRTACTIATQIIAQVASGQHGGQTISLSHLSPFVRISKERITNEVEQEIDIMLESISDDWGFNYKRTLDTIVERRLAKEISDGIQTLQYQINTLQTSNGQAPFLTIFMYIDEYEGYQEETAMLIEEMLKQRYIGLKNEVGVYISPAFPKLIYALDENNILEDSKYKYITELAAKCVAKRMMPDFVSVKILKENYEGNVVPSMGCRSHLSPWKNDKGEYVLYSRFNMGVCTLNLPDVGLSANKDMNAFWRILDERLQLCLEAQLIRYNRLKTLTSDASPIHWQHGAIARLPKHTSISPLLDNGFATISLGYIGVHECVKSLIGESHTTPRGEKLALEIMDYLRQTCDKWKKDTKLGFGLYGCPSESLTYTFARKLKDRFGVIEGVTDRDFITNSYHVHVEEKIDAFSKLKFESQFHKISSGGAISYIEVPNLQNNIPAVMEIIKFMYDNVQYAEINTKSDNCHECGFEGEILVNEGLEWVCPNCGNKDKDKMNVVRRTCGYLGENFWNEGRTQEIRNRVLHL